LSANPDSMNSLCGLITRMTTTIAWGDIGSARSPYQCFLLRPASGLAPGPAIEYRTIRASYPPTSYPPTEGTFRATGYQHFRSLPGVTYVPAVSDLCAIPSGEPTKPGEVWLHLTTGTKILQLELNEQRVLEYRGWQSDSATSDLTHVRSVYPESVPDDPDGGIESVFASVDPPFPTLTHYARPAGSPNVFVVRHFDRVHGYVPTPGSNTPGICIRRSMNLISRQPLFRLDPGRNWTEGQRDRSRSGRFTAGRFLRV
jgi:hypothetical protein